MKVLSYVVSSAIVMCGLVSIDLPASAVAIDITGTWKVTFHTPPPDGDLPATFVLKQDGVKISGTYDGPGGSDDVTGTIKGSDVVLTLAKQTSIASTREAEDQGGNRGNGECSSRPRFTAKHANGQAAVELGIFNIGM